MIELVKREHLGSRMPSWQLYICGWFSAGHSAVYVLALGFVYCTSVAGSVRVTVQFTSWRWASCTVHLWLVQCGSQCSLRPGVGLRVLYICGWFSAGHSAVYVLALGFVYCTSVAGSTVQFSPGVGLPVLAQRRPRFS